MKRKKWAVLFYVLIIIFTVCYWSFFPGGYTVDSYVSYLSSLGIIGYREAISPIFALYWKILSNYNFAPLLVNYLIFVAALILSIKFTKNYYIAVFSLIGICFPYTLVTYIFAWRDNALLGMLFLAAVLCLNRNKSVFYSIFTIIIFVIAFSLRLNAVIAIVPLLFYFLVSRHSKLKSVILTAVLIIGFQLVNKGVNKFIFNAEPNNIEQTQMYTDIAKINYWQKKNVVQDIPEEFVNVSNLNSENVDRMFQLYCNFSCNDILYMYPDWQGAKPFLRFNPDVDAQDKLRNNWLSKIIKNPFTYLRVRSAQLNNALWDTRTQYSPEAINFNEELLPRLADESAIAKGFDRNKIFQPATNGFAVSVRNFFGGRSEFFNLIGYPWLYLIVSIIVFIIFLLNYRKNTFYRAGVYLSLSGIFYTLGYLPLLPCTDYRYFIWTIFSFWVSIGVLVLAITSKDVAQPAEEADKSLSSVVPYSDSSSDSGL